MVSIETKEGTVQSEGQELFYRLTTPTEEPPRLSVLLLHGLLYSSENWLKLGTLQKLAEAGYEAVAIDLPGLGQSKESTAPASVGGPRSCHFLLNVLKGLNLGPVVIISPSLSGMYSLPFLFGHNDLVKGFIPVAPICTEKFSAEQYTTVQTPTLIIYGERKTMGHTSLNKLKNLGNHKVHIMKGAPHACYLHDPEEWHQTVLEFLHNLS
ncbi:LOW QUALITY PROTEIN: protein ABHD14B [Scyliorhinus canicula]|uniref:LOW QUALITY PROTEIN: protein ABHD14B n=1 Tax=Scyliorhinus canicula TaxID=7830 RepID=UPI0018F521BB|nr:LOW QUALITY PROTEIN: protein ABHD14B [Scyliorhinus canicula]